MIRRLHILFDWIRARKIRVVDVIFTILLVSSYMTSILLGIELKLDFNFNLNTKIDVGYFCILDQKGSLYIVDSGKERLFKVKDNKVEWEILIGQKDKICEIENVVVGDDENVYIHETQWDETGFLVDNESIHKYGSDGKYIETQCVCKSDENNKKGKATLFNLRVVDGHVEYIRLYDYGFEVFKIINNESIVKSKYLFDDAETFVQAIAVSPNTNNIYMVDKRGKILCTDKQGGIYTYYQFKDDVVPYDLDIGSDESIYFTDLRSKSVGRISPKKELEEVFSKQSVFKDETMDKNLGSILNVSSDNVILQDGTKQDVICGIFDVGMIYAVTQNGELVHNQSVFEPSENYTMSKIIVFILPIVVVICAVILGIRLIFVMLFNKSKLNLLFVIEITIILTAITVLVTILPIFSSSVTDVYVGGMSEKVRSVAEIVSKGIDPEKLRNINKASDFMNDDYKDLLETFKTATFYSGDDGEQVMGGVITKFIDDVVVIVMYPHVRTGAYVPASYSEKQGVIKIYETKQSVIHETHVTTGDYLTAKFPIFDNNGEVVGCVSIVKDMTLMRAMNRSLIEQIGINVLSVIVLGIFIMNEAIAFMKQRGEYRKIKHVKKRLSNGDCVFSYHVLRLSNVVFSMSLNISSGFLPIYALSFYSSYLSEAGISKVVAGSIPLSINVACIFLAFTLALSFFEKFGFKRVIVFAVCCSIVSDIMLATINSYNMLVLALALNGIGYGLLTESKRSYLSKLPYDELNRVQIVCSSGGSSGKFIGLFIGGFLAAILQYNEVFWMAVLIDVVAFGFCIYFCKTYSGSKQHSVAEKSKMSLLQFMLSKEVFYYLISVPVILGIIAGFAGYYIPMYGSMNNFYGNEISLSLAVVSFCPVFFASSITDAVIKKFGKNSIYIAVLTALMAMILLVNFSQLVLFVSSLLILGIAYSFGLGVCRYRFSQMNKVRKYGENRAQSIYNLFFAIGNTMSTIVFGMILSGNMVAGMWTFAIVIVAIMVVYKIFFDRKNNVN